MATDDSSSGLADPAAVTAVVPPATVQNSGPDRPDPLKRPDESRLPVGARRARLLALPGELRDILVSLKLTVLLLGLSMVLIFVGTVDQVDLGIWAAQEKYFHSFFVYFSVGPIAVPVFPGGYTIGGLLVANLIASHVYRYTWVWRKFGVYLTHLGLIVLLVGELLTGLWQQEYHMRINEGETKNYAESSRHYELVFIDTAAADFDDVVSIPERLVASKTSVQHPKLPFRVVAKTYYPNSTVHQHRAAPVVAGDPAAQSGTGGGYHLTAEPKPITYRPDERNVPSANVELSGPDGSLGVYLVSAHLAAPQTFTYAGRPWQIALRAQRAYQPFSLTLLKFSHDRYAGTGIPKNFSSRLQLKTADGRDDREVLIYMNNPLRHAGLTFYQSGYDNDDRTTILQVVRNPSWTVPYVACTLMTLGLVLQFGIHLVGFAGKQRVNRGPLGPDRQAVGKDSRSSTAGPEVGPCPPVGATKRIA